MPNFETLHLFFRTVEIPSLDKKPQFQVLFKSDETLPFKEESPQTLVRLKVLPETQLYFRLIVHKPNDVITANASIPVKSMALTPFEPKTFSLPFSSDSGDTVFFIFDAFSYYVTTEEGGSGDNPILFDLEFYNLLGLDYLLEKVEKPIKKKHLIGFTMIEYEMIFSYMQQIYNYKFLATDNVPQYGRNVFVASNPEGGVLNVKIIAHEYEWFVEGQKKALRASKPLAETTIPLNEFLQNESTNKRTLKLLGEFGVDYSIRSRNSPFLKNFVGYVDFRVLSTTFNKETITAPTIVLKQLGSSISWDLEPFSKSKTNNQYFWDFGFNRVRNELMKPEASKDTQAAITDFKSLINTNTNEISTVETSVHPEMNKVLDFLYQVEQEENDLEKEELKLAYQKNGAFFCSTVPNETIVLEVYQNAVLLGYTFFPLANINMDQNFFEEIVAFGGEDTDKKLGEVLIRAQFHPINIEIDKNLYNNLESLDFDDISERFSHPSKLYEAYLLMDKNLEKSKNLIWPKLITNGFKELSTPKRLILNLCDLQNISNVFSKKLNFNELEIRVRISDVQQVLKLNYSQITLNDVKTKYPKEYFLFTQTFYKQVLVEQDEQSVIIFQTTENNTFGVITLKKSPNYHHFEFTVQHPKETCSFSLFSQGKILDYQIMSLDSLPIAEEVDSLSIPLRLPSYKGTQEKGTLFLNFQTMSFPEEAMTNNFTSGVFVLERMKVRSEGKYMDKSALSAIYDFEIQTPQGLIHKIVNLASDAAVDRTCFEHLAEIKVEESAEIKLIIYKFLKGSGLDDEQRRQILFEGSFQLIALKGEDNPNDDTKVIALKPNSSAERRIEFRDEIGKKGSPVNFPLQFRFVHKVNKFIDNPEGVLTVRLNNTQIEFLKQYPEVQKIASLKVYLSDFDKQIKESPAFLFLERSLDDPFNQPKIQTYDWTNKLVVEAYDLKDVFLGRSFMHLSDIPFTGQEEVIKPVIFNGIRMNILLSYKPLLGDEDQEDQTIKPSQAGGAGDTQAKKAKNKNLGLIENLKQRIKDLEKDNLILRTNVNKVGASLAKKQKTIEKLQNFNSNFEESKKAFGQTERTAASNATRLPAATSARAKELFNAICQCGNPAPKFKGYCADCLKRLKEDYERCMQEYFPIAEKYESVAVKKHNFSKKKVAIEKKLQTYERKAKEFKFDFINEEEELLKDEIKTLKAALLEKKNEVEIIQQEHYYKIEEMKAKQRLLENLAAVKTKKLENVLSEVENL